MVGLLLKVKQNFKKTEKLLFEFFKFYVNIPGSDTFKTFCFKISINSRSKYFLKIINS